MRKLVCPSSAPEPSPQPVRRTRTSVPRTKTGCRTCRIRHVKCDEQRPGCGPCNATGRHCDGYSAEATNSEALSALRLTIASYAIPFRIPGGRIERRVLHYYCVQGNADLSGFYSLEFWKRLVMRYSHYEPVVRQCVTALASAQLQYSQAHRPADMGSTTKDISVDVLQHHTKALRQLRKYLESGTRSKKVVLMCSILLSAYDSLWGAYDSAVRHIDNGCVVWKQIKQEMEAGKLATESSSEYSNVDTDVQTLSQTIAHLDMDAMTLDPGRVPFELEASPRLQHQLRVPTVYETTVSIEQACLALRQLHSETWSFLRESNPYRKLPADQIPYHVLARKQDLLEKSENWARSFEKFIKNVHMEQSISYADKERIMNGGRVLRLHQISQYKLLVASLPYDYEAYNNPNDPLVEEMLLLSRSLLETDENAHSPGSNTYAMEAGVIAPLFNIATRTSSIVTLNKACELLRAAAYRREGLLDTEMCLTVATQWQEIKQRGGVLEEHAALIRALRLGYYKSRQTF